MDKTNLYYIVTKGTNDRALTTDKRLLIAESDAADREIERWHGSGEKITIEEFEKRFMDDKINVSNIDKSELYYIIVQGTNSRYRNENEEPVMFLSNHVDRFLEQIEAHRGAGFDKITVEEYERTFGV
jgi:hypothetical protein